MANIRSIQIGLLVAFCSSISGASAQTDLCRYGSGCVYGCYCADGCNQTTGVCESGGLCPSDDPSTSGLLRTGPGCIIGNVARNKTATQSGQVGSYHAALAVDGSVDTYWCAKPDAGFGNRAWWYVDLEDSYTVVSVTIFNRDDSQEYFRTGYFRLGVGYVTDGGMTRLCSLFNSTVPYGGQETIQCDSPVSGRYVTIMRHTGSYMAQYLGLCEVMVHGYKPTGCDDYHYGDNCSSQCSSSCQVSSSRQCYSTDGTCITCDTGKWGTKCDKICIKCKNNLCDIGSGQCTQGCINGYYGEACSSQCSTSCLNRTCSSPHGRCSSGCTTEGYWGDRCNETCNIHCKNNSCSQDTGSCTEGCEGPYYGDQCQHTCSSGCHVTSGSSTCHRDTGMCNNGCVTGQYGENCTTLCNTNCSAVNGTPVCDRSTGACSQGCKDGLYSEICDLLCSSQCSGENVAPSCDMYSGACVCLIGYYGKTCGHRCGRHCETISNTQTCEKDSGVCTHGCQLPPYDTWYTGEHCNMSTAYMEFPDGHPVSISEITPTSITMQWSHVQVIPLDTAVMFGYLVTVMQRNTEQSLLQRIRIGENDAPTTFTITLAPLAANTTYQILMSIYRQLPGGKTEDSRNLTQVATVTTLPVVDQVTSPLSLTVTIAIGAICGAVIIAAIAAVLFFCYRKFTRSKAEEHSEPYQDTWSHSQPGAGHDSPSDSEGYEKPRPNPAGYENLTGVGHTLYEEPSKEEPEYEEIRLDFHQEK